MVNERRIDINWADKAQRHIDVDTIKHTNVREVGTEWMCYHTWNQLQLSEFLQEQGWNETQIQLAATQVISGKYILPAMFTYPKTGSRFPVVILVHGSGPNDKDETLGPNKIFKDLAYGLASKDIAVMRYEKRTRQYQTECFAPINDLTIKEEVIDDALAAIQTAKSVVAIDPARIYICGHSLGAMCAPRIAAQSNEVAGIILLAGNARPLEDLVLEQVKYLSSLKENNADSKKSIDDLQVQVLNVKSLTKESDIESYQLPLSLPKNYWLALKNYNQIVTAKSLSCKILIMQGVRDYQITTTDYNLWQKELKGFPNVQFKLYDKLNHLFMEGTGKSTPDEYDKEGNVPEYVVSGIADFCK
ncbi:MAG: alpha/beta hydrolase [Bacteroidia bacterium]